MSGIGKTGKKGRGCVYGTCLVWSALAAIAMLLLTAFVFYGSFRSAQGRVQAELKRVQEAGEPIDDQSMTDWFRSHTHTQGTEAWQQIIAETQSLLKSSPNLSQLPVFGDGKLPVSLKPEETWQEEPKVAEFLNSAKPIINLVNAASIHPTPVWMPLDFKGVLTLLPEVQSSRDVVRILHLDFYHALHHRDKQRAIQALQSMRLTADAFDWQAFLVTYLVHLALEGMTLDSLGRSLEFDLWSEQELQDWMKLIEQPSDVALRWRNSFAGERYGFLSASAKLSQATGGTPSGISDRLIQLPQAKIKLLEVVRKSQELGEGDLSTLVQRCAALEAEVESERGRMQFHPGNIAMGLFVPSYAAIASAIERQEDSRRLVRMALAIKLYQIRSGKWPNSLTELREVGATPDDWNTLNKGTFGYLVEDDQAWLWSYPLGHQSGNVPTTRPNQNSENGTPPQIYRIR